VFVLVVFMHPLLMMTISGPASSANHQNAQIGLSLINFSKVGLYEFK